MKILVLDFPSEFFFPPYGYGGIERWIWSVAKQSLALGHEVILSGPKWRVDTLKKAKHFPERISKETVGSFKKKFGQIDIIVGGHEYWANVELLDIFNDISNKTFTYQLINNDIYKVPVFDNKKNFLFCFSDEMASIFRAQSPTLSLCSSEGYLENPIKSKPEGCLVWLGRLDEDKSPHYAALAAAKMKIPLYIVGKTEYQPEYMKQYGHYFENKYIKLVGELAGKKKSEIIAKSSAAIYTCSKDWVEAAGMIFSEYLRSGVPIAAMAWRDGTSAQSAIDSILGDVAMVSENYSQETVVNKLIDSISYSLKLDRDNVFKKGNEKFDPFDLVKSYLDRISKT